MRKPKSTIEIGDGTYLSHVWFVGDGERDWLAALMRFPGNEHFTFHYRFRYYASADVNDDNEKSGIYHSEFVGKTEDEAVALVDKMIETGVLLGFSAEVSVDKVEIKSADVDRCLETLAPKEWVHFVGAEGEA